MFSRILVPTDGSKLSQKAIQTAVRLAKASGAHVSGAADAPWEGIIRCARRKSCDLVVMASHGRRGLRGLVLGSETAKVLTHSKIPVLVCR